MHDHKEHSEERCVRCGWVMGHPPLNCNNDGTPHVFPSQLAAHRPWLHRVLDRLFPHDTLRLPDGTPYMHRWYVAGYAPTPDDPDAKMICAAKMAGTDGNAPCGMGLQRGCSAADGTGEWSHLAETFDLDHAPVPISAPRDGWRWQDHGLGAVRIHCILASDDQRAFHDHPWAFASVGLVGAYTEVVPRFVDHHPDGTLRGASPVDYARNPRRRCTAPFINRKAATDLHALIVDGKPVWTLFLSRPKIRSWGFATQHGWIPWREFDAAATVEP